MNSIQDDPSISLIINKDWLGYGGESTNTDLQSSSPSKHSYKDSLYSFNAPIDDNREHLANALNVVDNSLVKSIDGSSAINISLSSDEKSQLHAKWQLSLIVKVFGKKVGFKFLVFKLEQIWKIKNPPAVIYLGEDFFLLKFHNEDDYNYVLKEGPWFIAGHFLTVRMWLWLFGLGFINPPTTDKQEEEGFGPWMVVSRKKGKMKMGVKNIDRKFQKAGPPLQSQQLNQVDSDKADIAFILKKDKQPIDLPGRFHNTNSTKHSVPFKEKADISLGKKVHWVPKVIEVGESFERARFLGNLTTKLAIFNPQTSSLSGDSNLDNSFFMQPHREVLQDLSLEVEMDFSFSIPNSFHTQNSFDFSSEQPLCQDEERVGRPEIETPSMQRPSVANSTLTKKRDIAASWSHSTVSPTPSAKTSAAYLGISRMMDKFRVYARSSKLHEDNPSPNQES
ncbi:hypothetical protein COLO4_35995 [Corchorus olitorius]|uniref:DUF4283 domain-containing protein n=1 Tax=Corchorus olitorius TaxID=93759 RepID=A0A1R3GBP0_9ROSI|nr:hypothetical protein COLO4_35995 [Corchorus olitorius]